MKKALLVLLVACGDHAPPLEQDAPSNGCAPGVPDPAPAHVHAGIGTAAGMTCLAAGCHDAGHGTVFTFAGTVYVTRGVPAAGATLRVGAVTVQADSAGNFVNADPVAFPVQPIATMCPALRQMGSPVGDGNCNGCHNDTVATPIFLR